MPLVIPPGFAAASIQFRHENDPEPWYVTMGLDISDAGGATDAIALKVMDGWDDNIMPQYSNQVSITGVDLVIGQDGPDPVRTFLATTSLRNGSETGQKLPQNCAMLVRKNTALGGRRNRGRMFVPGILNEASVTATGIIDPSSLAILQGQQALFLAYLASAGGSLPAIPMVLLHSTGLSPVPDPTPVTSLTIDNVISTQRRRLR
jgi:hypothetical protein